MATILETMSGAFDFFDNTTSMDMRENNTYTLIHEEAQQNGSWRFEGNQLALLGNDIPLVFQYSPVDDRLTWINPRFSRIDRVRTP